MRNIIVLLTILFAFTACETGYKGDSNALEEDNNPMVESKSSLDNYEFNPHYEEDLPVVKFEGGHINDGLDLGMIRVSQTPETIRMVLDSYRLDAKGKRSGKVNRVGVYTFVYHPEKRLISATINGYRAFSADLPEFPSDSLVEKMYMDKYLDDSGYRFHIKLREDVNVKVFDLENPGRIVIDMGLL